MENKTVTVLKQKNEHFLVHWAENELTPFVVCTDYNTKSNSWIWGHYFQDITSAVDYYESQFGNRKVNYDRLCELATLFKDGLIQDDFESALEYFEDSCEMEKSEMDFFGITDEIQEKRNQEIQWLLNETDNMDFEDIDLDCIFD